MKTTEKDAQLIESFFKEVERNIELSRHLPDDSSQELFEYKMSTNRVIDLGLRLKDVILYR